MDPKQNAQLDPKLKEAYDRVMGTATPPTSPVTSTPQPVDPVVATPATPSPVTTPTVPSPVPVVTAPSVQPTPATSPLPVTPVVMPHSTETVRIGGDTPIEVQHTTTGVVAKEKKKGISPTILILGAIVFLAVYALFWIKFLNVPIPFLNQ